LSAEQIEATGNALSGFGILELVILGVIAIVIIVVMVLGKRLVDVWMAKINNDSQKTIISLNSENTKIEAETNAIVKKIIDRIEPLEEIVRNLQKKTENDIQDIENIKKMLDDDTADRIKRQAELDNELNSIKLDVKNIYTILSDHEEFQGVLSEGTLENMLFSKNPSVFRKLKAFLRLIAMKKNGRIKETGFDLILQNKDVWLTVLEVMPKLKLGITDKDYFDSVLKDIDQRFFDGMMW
jgi:hypothetical protein